MTDLTEQWKKGELPEGFYYVKDGENMIAEYLDGYFYNNGEPMISFSGGVDEILAPVPSYEELQNINKAVNECMAANIKLVEENKQIKELLKEIRGKLHYINTPKNQHNIFGNNIMKRIDEVLR
jgi:hypothetical protein